MNDPTEEPRRVLVDAINAEPGSRAALESGFGQVWDTDEMTRDFSVQGFMAPFVIVLRRSDGVKGTLTFQHNPRFYFEFQADGR